jgi:hypothetical protein
MRMTASANKHEFSGQRQFRYIKARRQALIGESINDESNSYGKQNQRQLKTGLQGRIMFKLLQQASEIKLEHVHKDAPPKGLFLPLRQ